LERISRYRCFNVYISTVYNTCIGEVMYEKTFKMCFDMIAERSGKDIDEAYAKLDSLFGKCDSIVCISRDDDDWNVGDYEIYIKTGTEYAQAGDLPQWVTDAICDEIDQQFKNGDYECETISAELYDV